MVLRDEFERLGVPEHLLAQVIWAELDPGEYSNAEMIALGRRLFPDGIHEMIEDRLGRRPATPQERPGPQSVHNLMLRLRRSG